MIQNLAMIRQRAQILIPQVPKNVKKFPETEKNVLQNRQNKIMILIRRPPKSTRKLPITSSIWCRPKIRKTQKKKNNKVPL